MRRYEDWPERLAAFIQENQERPFRWGVWDCCLAAADMVVALTGEDPAAFFRGTYDDDQETADGYVEDAGSLLALVEGELQDFVEVSPNLAQRGDLVLLEREGRALMGFVGMRGELLAPGTDGLVAYPRVDVLKAWRV